MITMRDAVSSLYWFLVRTFGREEVTPMYKGWLIGRRWNGDVVYKFKADE